MNRSPLRRADLFLLLGLGDLATGVALVAAPGLVASLLGLRLPLGPDALPVVGAFVAGVGLASAIGSRRAWLVDGSLASTAVVRACVALVLVGGVAAAGWSPGWLAVAAYDAAVASLQGSWLRGERQPGHDR